VQTYKTALEKVAQRERLAPAVVVGIAYNEARKDEEKVHRKVTVVYPGYNSAALCERKALVNMVPHH